MQSRHQKTTGLFASFFRRIRESEAGNVAVIAALSVLPLVALAGGAVDFSRAHAARSALQSACDQAALSAMRARLVPGQDYVQVAKDYFRENVAQEFKNSIPTVTLVNGDMAVQLDVTHTIATTTLALVNMPNMPVSVSCRAEFGTLMPMEVSFVLDYSGSMKDAAGNGQEKWESMRDATLQLIKQLTANHNYTEVKIGLTPFSRYVRATLPAAYVRGQAGADITDCYTDRDYPFNISDATPDGSAPSKWPIYTVNDTDSNANGYCQEMADNNLDVLPLTNDYTLVTNTLNSYLPANWTNIQLGIAFGWHVLSSNEPFAEGTTYNNPDIPKVLIVLSDGMHNQKGQGPGGTYTVSQAEQNIEQLCTEVKNKGVTIFTIAYQVPDEATRTRLRQCSSAPNTASDHPHYYEPYSGEALFSVFAGIGRQLNPDSLRVSR